MRIIPFLYDGHDDFAALPRDRIQRSDRIIEDHIVDHLASLGDCVVEGLVGAELMDRKEVFVDAFRQFLVLM